jgi:hypothetical protein
MFLYVRETHIQTSLRGTKQSQTTQIGFAKLLCKSGIINIFNLIVIGINELPTVGYLRSSYYRFTISPNFI